MAFNTYSPKIFHSEWQRWIDNPNYQSVSDVGGGSLLEPGGGGLGGAGGGIPYQDLAKSLNDFMAQQAKQQYVSNYPGYESNLAQSSENVGAWGRGEFSPGEMSRLVQSMQERGVGMPGSPSVNAATLAAILGKTEEKQKLGLAGHSQLVADTPVSPLWNPASLFVPEYLARLEMDAVRAGRGSVPGYGGFGGGGYTPSYRSPSISPARSTYTPAPATGPGRELNPSGPFMSNRYPQSGMTYYPNVYDASNDPDWLNADNLLWNNQDYDNFYNEYDWDDASNYMPYDAEGNYY